jgi:hypothetical protein
MINKRIHTILEEYGWNIKTEKDKTATVLIVIDYLEWTSKFIKDTNIIHKKNDW